MAELLDALHALYNADRDVRRVREQIDRRKQQVNMQQRRIEKLVAECQAMEQELRQRRAAAAEHDLEVNAFDNKIAKLRVDLNKAKTNKEYAAVLTEINTAKADSSKLESTTLQLMEEIDTRERDLAESHKKIAAEEEKLTRLREECEAFERQTADELASLEAKRERAAEVVPPQARATYERVANSYDGEALAQVVQLHPKRQEFSCTGCNMGVRLEQVNALKSRDDIECCNICGRILYLDAPKTQTISG